MVLLSHETAKRCIYIALILVRMNNEILNQNWLWFQIDGLLISGMRNCIEHVYGIN